MATKDGAALSGDPGRDLFGRNQLNRYNEDEQRFSQFVEGRLERLLRGDLNRLVVLRRYHRDPDRLGVPLPKSATDGSALRLPVVERLLRSVAEDGPELSGRRRLSRDRKGRIDRPAEPYYSYL